MKIHLIATNRGEGKTTWLKDQINKVTYNMSPRWKNSHERIVILLPSMRHRELEHRDIAHLRHPVYWGTFDQMEIPFCGMSSCAAIFVDEYQKMTPSQWDELTFSLYKSNAEELYLAGDVGFTFDQLARNPNDTEHLYRRLSDAEHELNKQRR